MNKHLLRLCACLFAAGWLGNISSWAGNLKVFYPATHTGWVLETPSGKVYVIDPGVLGEFYDTRSTGGMGIGTYLKKQGITTIHGMVISHPHGDHYDAGVKMFQDFTVLELIDTGFNPNNNARGGYDTAFWDAFQASGATRRTGLRVGDVLNWDPELTVQVLGPKDPFWTYEEAGSDPERHFNQNSLVLWVQHGSISYMFTGDITAPAQNFLQSVSPVKTRDTAILGIPHHGKWYYHNTFAEAVGSTHPLVRLGIISESHTDKGDAADQLDEWQGAGLTMYAGDGNNEVTAISTGGNEFRFETTNPESGRIFSTVTNYAHAPFFTGNGANYLDIAQRPSTRLTNFSASAWFRTPNAFTGTKMIVNRGGFNGGDAAGTNMNYGIWMLANGRIEAGFETSAGANVFATSPAAYNNGQWHHAAVSYNQSVLRLYLDGALVHSVNSTAVPDILGNSSIRVGADSSAMDRFFVGDIDEVRVWNRAISAGEVSNAYAGGRVNLDGLVAELDMGCQKLSGTNFFEQASIAQLQLTNFVLQAQFRTTAPPPPTQVSMIVNKGGFGSDASGHNMNYGLWIDGNGHLVGGFEGSGGGDYFATSSRTVNDGLWHLAGVSFDGSAVVLTLDGVEVARTTTTTKPDISGTQPLRVGANSRSNDRYFVGDVDYVHIINPDVGTVYWSRFNQSEYTPSLAPPRIAHVAKTNSELSVEVDRATGVRYSLWRASGLETPAWSQVLNAVITTNGNTIGLTDPNPSANRSFYRVQATAD